MRGYTLHKDDYAQIASGSKALQNVGLGLLDEHLRHCVMDALAAGTGDEKVTEAIHAVERHLRV